jgi:SAM-dependent methyltransferase
MSIDFYDANADAYFAETVDTDVGPLRDRFLKHLSPGGRILDAGCGSGRDALAFAKAGFVVTAFDGSAAMARLAARHCCGEVRHMTFAEVRWTGEFDGVWSCASLLHVPRAELPGVLARLANALRPGGVLFASFKLGTGDRVIGGRRFTDLTPQGLLDLMSQSALHVLDHWVSVDARPGREGEQWVSAIGQLVRPR